MNILIISKEGLGLPVGWRLKSEGHKVKMATKKPQLRVVGEGFLDEIIDDYTKALSWSDFIICDDSGQGEIADELRKQGHMVWGSTEFCDKWEEDRDLGQDILRQAGMEVLPDYQFSNIDKAISFIKEHPDTYVVKPDGKIQDEKSLVYVGEMEDGSDMIEMLESYRKWGNKINSFILQQKARGIEVACSGFFNGNDFVEPIEVSFEHKNLCNGPTNAGIGPKTGEMGTSQVWVSKQNKIYSETISKVIPYLKEEGYIGYLDINCIATPTHIYPLEFTCRFGYPTIELWMETIEGDLGELFYELANGVQRDFKVKNPYSVVVVLAAPPLPYDAPEIYKKMTKDTVIIFKDGKTPKSGEGVWPEEVKLVDNKWICDGLYGYPLVCSGSGKSIYEAKNQAYARIQNIILPNSFYRTDISSTTPSQLNQLQEWGWISNSLSTLTKT